MSWSVLDRELPAERAFFSGVKQLPRFMSRAAALCQYRDTYVDIQDQNPRSNRCKGILKGKLGVFFPLL